MCWSGEASFALAGLGFAGAYCSRRWGGLPPSLIRWSRKLPGLRKRDQETRPPKRQGHETFRWLPLVYFSVMETLQGITYSYIGECGETANQTLTYLSYIHIAFQPFFVNMFAMSWLKKEARKELTKWVWPVCAFATAIMLMMLTGQAKWGTCDTVRQMLCGADTCSYHGEWHIAWRLPLSNLDPNYLVYWLSAFIVPLIYRSWRFVLYHFTFGPLLAWFLTGNKDERAAVWCLASIAFLLATHIPFIARLLSGDKKKRPTNKDDLKEYPVPTAHGVKHKR